MSKLYSQKFWPKMTKIYVRKTVWKNLYTHPQSAGVQQAAGPIFKEDIIYTDWSSDIQKRFVNSSAPFA